MVTAPGCAGLQHAGHRQARRRVRPHEGSQPGRSCGLSAGLGVAVLGVLGVLGLGPGLGGGHAEVRRYDHAHVRVRPHLDCLVIFYLLSTISM